MQNTETKAEKVVMECRLVADLGLKLGKRFLFWKPGVCWGRKERGKEHTEVAKYSPMLPNPCFCHPLGQIAMNVLKI